MEKLLNRESVRLRDEAVNCEPRQQRPTRRGQRNGFYWRDFVSRFGTLCLKIARTRERSFLPGGLERFQRRAAEVMLLSREAFLRGLSTRQVGRVVAILTDEVVSAQTVSKLSRSLDRLVKAFHQARLKDEWVYLFLDRVSLRVRRPGGRKRVQMLVAYGVRRDGSRRLLAFLRSQGASLAEVQRAWLHFKWNWQRAYPGMVRRLEKDLPELLTFFRFPRSASGGWHKLRTIPPYGIIERCFVEVRRRTRPMVCFVNVDSVDRIIYAIFNGLNDQWRNRTLRISTQAA